MPARRSAVAGVVLAAGLSRRFGRNKLIEPFRGKPLLRWVVEAALRSRLASVIVVLGHEHDRVAAALEDLAADPRLASTVNRSYAQGQSTSVIAGISAMPGGCDGAMFLVADQPLVDHRVIDRLIAAFERAGGGICYPVRGDRRCNPVIFASAYFSELRQLTGDGGGRIVIDNHRDACVSVEFPGALQFRDVDLPGDIDALALQGTSGEAATGPLDLVRALGLEASRVISLCGSGGKTSLMSSLVEAFASNPAERILATTTTKLGADEMDGPWQPRRAGRATDILAMTEDYSGPILAYRRLDSGRRRLLGFPPDVVDELARSDRYTRIVVEADGSRRRPLKAPGADEPAFPAATDTVVAVAGVSGLGRPSDDETVFRPDIWSALTGLPAGSAATPDALARVIAHPDGLMRGAPPQARRLVFLNQVDTPDRLTLAAAVLDRLAACRDCGSICGAIGRLKPEPMVHALREIGTQARRNSGGRE